MMNYACDFSQSEMEKYYEWIIDKHNIIIDKVEYGQTYPQWKAGCISWLKQLVIPEIKTLLRLVSDKGVVNSKTHCSFLNST